MPLGACESDAVLSEYLAGLFVRPLPPPPLPYRLPPVDRRWFPDCGAWPQSLMFKSRHPLFEGCSQTVRELKPKRPSRVARIGWRGVFQSVKTARAINYRSRIELAAFKQAEVDPSVPAYLEQPCGVVVNQRLPVSFDLCRQEGEITWLIVCRSEETAGKPEKQEAYNAIGKAVAAAGYGFEVFTELHGSTEPMAGNTEEILHGRFVELTPTQVTAIQAALQSGPLPLGYLGKATGLTMEQLYRSIIVGIVHVDVRSAPLSQLTLATAMRGNVR